MDQNLKIADRRLINCAYLLALLLAYLLVPKPAFANSMQGLVVIVVPPFIVLGANFLKFLFFFFRGNEVTALLLLKLLFSAVWECLLFFATVYLLEVFGPIPSSNMILFFGLLGGWAVIFSAFSLYPNLLFFRKDTMLSWKKIQRALIFGLMAPIITILLYIYLLMHT